MTNPPNKNALIEAMLAHVPFDGWTNAAVMAAADELEIDRQQAHALLPNGVGDAIAGFVAMGDAAMVAEFDRLAQKPDGVPKGVSAKIKTLILLRLEVATPHREAVAAAMKTLARPKYAGLSLRITASSIDRMWRAAGDTSVDFSFYSKRTILAGVFATCLAWWVANPNADAAQREKFVAARLRDAAVVPKLTAPINSLAKTGIQFAGRMMNLVRPRFSESA